jgi:chemotaxis protein MotB
MQSYTREILHEIGKLLNDVPNRVGLSGHTDARPYAGGERGYSNWELSADRANSSRRELIVGGMEETKILRVVGLGASALFDRENPFGDMNRRISIIVMRHKAEEAVRNEGAMPEAPPQLISLPSPISLPEGAVVTPDHES